MIELQRPQAGGDAIRPIVVPKLSAREVLRVKDPQQSFVTIKSHSIF